MLACAGVRCRGSPLSQRVTFEMLRRTRHMGLEACLALELHMVANFMLLQSDFREGVRAMLIDRGSTPAWRHAAAEDVPDELVETFFQLRPGVCMLASARVGSKM